MIFLGIYLAGSVLAALAPNIWYLMAGRLVQGIGASVGMTVSRAIVRDQFTGAQSARIMNMIGIMLAIGPAVAPTVGGLALVAFGWQSIFVMMVGFGITAVGVVLLAMPETVTPDPSHFRPGSLVRSYLEILGNQHFVSAALTIACSVGSLYALATILPFLLIDQVGLTPAEYGIGMLAQSGSYLTGSIVFRQLLRRWSALQLVVPGLVFIGVAATMVFLSSVYLPYSYLSIMVPVGFFAFGIAFVLPHLTTVALTPFPHIAGSASAAMGFAQMGSGLVTGMISAMIGVPALSFRYIVPLMGLVSIASYIWHVRVNAEAERDLVEASVADPLVQPGE